MRTYASEVMQRLKRYDVAKSIDSGMLETSINLARYQVQLATLQTVPERYARIHRPVNAVVVSWENSARMLEFDQSTGGAKTIINQVGTVDLPSDFIADVTVGVSEGDVMWQARKVSKRDLYSVLTKSMTKPTPHNPIYCIERSTETANPKLFISTGTALPAQGIVEIWYLARLPWLQIANSTGQPDVEIRIGYDLQELVVTIACYKIMESLQIIDGRQLLKNDIELMVSALNQQYQAGIDRSRLFVEANESLVPKVPNINANSLKV
jgi:hypothetical protein